MRRLITILFTFISVQLFAVDYYFSNAGNNTNPGTEAQPFSTLDKLNSLNMTGNRAFLRRGDTFIGPLPINQSGSAGNPIIYTAYGTGELPDITGFQTLTSWTNVGGNIWQASLNAGAELNMLIIGSAPIMRGRYPQTGWLNFQSHSGYTSITDLANPSTNINWTNAYLSLRSVRFQLNTYKITGHNSSGTITYSGNQAEMQREPIDGHGYFIQDDPRTLTYQNAWYYNSTSQYVQMYSTVNPGTLGVQAATKNYLLTAAGKNYVTVQNIRFTGSNKISINWQGGASDTLRNCEIEYSGEDGVFLNGNTSTAFINNKVYKTNNTAVKALPNVTNTIVNYNDIQDAGVIPGYAKAVANSNQTRSFIFINGMYTEASHNTCRRSGYAGISFTRDGCKVMYNLIDSAVLVLDDVGGVYHSDAPQYGVDWEIAYNTITNCYGSSAGTGAPNAPGEGMNIYIDEAGGHGNIHHNNLRGAGLHSIFIHDADYILIRYNNAFDFYIYGFFASHDNLQPGIPLRGIVHEYNTYASTTSRTSLESRPNSLFALGSDNSDFGDLMLFGTSDYNKYIKPFAVNINDFIKTTIGSNIDSSYTLAAWQARSGQDLHSQVVYSGAYPSYTITSAGANQFPAGNFNTSVSNLVNEYPSTQVFTRDVTMMDTAALKVTYTGAAPATDGGSVWFFDTGNQQNWAAGTYIIDFDAQNGNPYEAQFFAVIRSANGSPSPQSQVLKFKVPPYRKHVQLLFNLDHTILNHFIVIYPDKAGSAPVFWVDNFKARPATVAYTNWRDYMDFKVAGSSPVQVNTVKAYLDEKRQRHGLEPVVDQYGSMFFFIDQSVQRIGGVIKPTQ